MKFPWLFFLLPLLLWSTGCQQKQSGSPDDALARAKELAHQFILVDTHQDVPYRVWKSHDDISQRSDKGHFDYVRAREGGLDVSFFAIYIPAKLQTEGGARALADSLIDMVEGFARRWPDKFVRVNSVEEVRRNFGQNKVMIALGIENGAALEGKLENLNHFYRRGVRYITLAHAKWNRICDSSYDPERHWHGLSPFGRKVVQEMNRLGMMVDVSHVSDETFYQVLEISRAPVIASHSSCRHFTPGFERNMSDEMIRKLAEKGGVIQINFGSYFVSQDFNQRAEGYRKEIEHFLEEHHLTMKDSAAKKYIEQYKKEHPLDRGTVATVADHIDHAVKIAGIDHVGLGSDFDGVGGLPVGLEDVSKYPNLIAELLRRGYSEQDIRKICGENFLRVWQKVEEIARQLQQENSRP